MELSRLGLHAVGICSSYTEKWDWRVASRPRWEWLGGDSRRGAEKLISKTGIEHPAAESNGSENSFSL